MDNSITVSDFQGSTAVGDELMQIVTDNTQFYERSTDVDMPEVDSSEIAAIVCGVPVMISDCEQDIDMRENEPSSIAETNLVKDSSKMELDISLKTKDAIIEISDCEIHNKINQLKDVSSGGIPFEKNCIDMELEVSENKKAVKSTEIETGNELKDDIIILEVFEKSKENTEITVSNNGKSDEIFSFESVTEVEKINDAVLSSVPSEKENTKMETENYTNEKTVTSSCQTSVDIEKQKDSNLCNLHSEVEMHENLNVSLKEKEMNNISGDTHETVKQVEKAKFYAVALPKCFFETESSPCIFTSKSDALAAIKKFPGARFMQFDSIDDAIEYSSKPVPLFTTPSALEEKSSKYKSITSQQMVALRKTIEKGEEAAFLDIVWSNPRYLINNAGDGPTVMQEGTRYNALHVAARFKQSAMCLTVLNTIQDCQFMSLLYPQETVQMIENRISRLIDLYLNTPDKSLSETPLHFACKFGADEILSILLSYHECDISKKNKYGLTPREMICDRTSHDPDFKKRMDLMFEELFYVPILRDLQNNIQEPVIGKPCRTDVFLASTSSELTYGEKNLVYCAFAGPMSEAEADKFYTLLKKRRKFIENQSFTPEEKKQLVDIRLSDSEKGLERVGRKLAKELDVGWIEFWPALEFWGDLSNEGLEFLEKKLKSHYKTELSPKSLMANRCENLKLEVVNFVNDFVQKFPVIRKKKDTMTFFVLFQSLLPHLYCLTNSSFSETKELYMIHYEIGKFLYLKLISAYKEYFEDFKFYLNKQFHTVDNLLKYHNNDAWKMFVCILKCMCYSHFSAVKSIRSPKCSCKWNIQRKFFYSSYFAHKYILNEYENYVQCRASTKKELSVTETTSLSPACTKSKEKDSAIVVPFQNLSLDMKVTNSGDFVAVKETMQVKENVQSAVELSPESSNDVFYLSNDSIEVEDDENIFDSSDDNVNHSVQMADSITKSLLEDTDDELEGFFTPPESPVFKENELFVKGINEFSDVDIDIFRAIVDSGARINQNEYPNVFEWKCVMELKLKSLLNPHDKLSCTPASSSASLRRAITPVDRVRRTLF